MNRTFWSTVGVGVVVLIAWAGGQVGQVGGPPATMPASATTQPTASGPADNSYCLTCHMNMNSEVLSASHQKIGVGCSSCHGESDKHSSDENGIIPPDVMFAKDRIYAACVKCHETEKLVKQAAHDPMFIPRPRQQACTECHGKHMMAVRTRRWDKVTRKLISDDGVRMVNDAANQKK